MNQQEQEQLLRELLIGDELSALRQGSLQQGLAALRRRRLLTRALRVSGLALALVALFVLALARPVSLRPTRASGLTVPPEQTTASQQASSVHFITDDELLALFPGRSVALVGKPGQQRLVFLDDLATASRARTF
jgi:hypothetical protein